MSRFSPSQVLPKRLHALFKRDIDNVRASPRFGAAMRAFTARNCSIITNGFEPAFGKYIGDISNVLLESTALHFHLLKTHRNIGFGATLSQLQLVAFIHGYASPRRVSMYVKRMLQVGRLEYAAASSDRRIRRLQPTEAMIETTVRHVADLMHACDFIWPGQDLEKSVLQDRELFYRIYIEIGKNYLSGADPLRPFTDVRHFTSKDSGSFLLNLLIQGCLNGDDKLTPKAEVQINFTEMARHCGATRTHIRNVVEAAAERELLVLNNDRSLSLTPKMITSIESYFSCLLILIHESAKVAGKA